ncbi:hypothetical protein [Synechococcus sp. MIT S1220]|uniref:hypothetical protein n=1 Tax=Synechococcus sp. MIT S1220 TaxID=3082549 RepID=UPI0039AF06AE
MEFVSIKEAIQIFGNLPEVLQSFIMSNGGRYGIPPQELLMKIPKHLLENPIEIFKFIKSKDISHKISLENGGSPSNPNNWIFEDAGPNRARQADPMGHEEYLDAQIDNINDGMNIDFGTPDPGTPGYNAAYKQAFGEEPYEVPNDVGDGFQDIFENMSDAAAADAIWDGMFDALAEIGIPFGYITFKLGFGGIFPFLKSVDWKHYKTDAKYRAKTLARALKAFREGGWKVAAKALLIGFLIAVFPPIAYFMAAVGLTGIAAMGTRWLASKTIKSSGRVGRFLYSISDWLDRVHKFLKNILAGLDKIVDVVLKNASTAVKAIYTVGKSFASSVHTISKKVAKDLYRVGKDTLRQASQAISNWIFSWFSDPDDLSYA